MNSSIKLQKSLMLFKRNFSQINLEKLLSEENKRKTIEKFRKYTKLRIGERNPDKHAAILIPLCIVDNEISVLYTIRSSKLRNYSGQVCFPGKFRQHFHLLLTWIQLISRNNYTLRWENGRHWLSRDRVRPARDGRRDRSEFRVHRCELPELFFETISAAENIFRFGELDRK